MQPTPGGNEHGCVGSAGHVERAARGGPVFCRAGSCWCAALTRFGGRHNIVAGKGLIGSPTARQPLAIDVWRSRVEPRGEGEVLFRGGCDTNRGTDTRAYRPIAIAITDRNGFDEPAIFWDKRRAAGAPASSIGFSSRVEAPSNGVRSVTVTFREE